MNRAQIVDAISNETGVTKKDVEMVVTSFSSTVKDSVQRGDDIQLIGFGAFKKVSKAARKCRHPKTGETIKVPVRKAQLKRRLKNLGSFLTDFIIDKSEMTDL